MAFAHGSRTQDRAHDRERGCTARRTGHRGRAEMEPGRGGTRARPAIAGGAGTRPRWKHPRRPQRRDLLPRPQPRIRSEEHTSELQSLMRISYAVFCLKKKKTKK